MRTLIALLFCGIGWLATPAPVGYCQDSTDEQLRKCINEFANSRASVDSYGVKINRLIYTPKVVTGATKEGKELFSLSQSRIEIVADCVNDRSLFIHSSSPFSWDTGTAAQSLYLSFATSFSRLTKTGFEAFPRKSAIVPDPLSLGGGLYPETTHFYSLTEVIDSLHSWHIGPENFKFAVKQSGPFVSFRDNDSYFVFDTTRDFQLVEIGSGSPNTSFQSNGRTVRRDGRVRGNVTPVLVNGIWLPGTVSYVDGESDFCHMTLDWVFVNQPIPDCLFDRGALEAFFLREEPFKLDTDATLKGPDRVASSQALPLKASPIEELFAPNRIPCIELALLLLDPSIQSELGITEAVQKHVIAALKELRQDAPSVATLRDEATAKRLELFQPLMRRAAAEDKKLWKVLDELLPPANMDRLMGGYLMMNGLSGVLHEHIAARLAIDDEQKQKIQRAIEALRIKKRQVLPLAGCGKLEEGDMPLMQPNRNLESEIIRLAMNSKQLSELDRLLINSRLNVPVMRFTFGW